MSGGRERGDGLGQVEAWCGQDRDDRGVKPGLVVGGADRAVVTGVDHLVDEFGVTPARLRRSDATSRDPPGHGRWPDNRLQPY